MTRPKKEVELADALHRNGLNDCQIARLTGIPRATIREWRVVGRVEQRSVGVCPRCEEAPLDESAYSYLLGIYLGDGCLSEGRLGVFKLRIVLDASYEAVNQEVMRAVTDVHPTGRVGFITKYLRGRPSYIEVYSYWKHWICLFPQHGAGRKHERDIRLAEWQQQLVERHPHQIVRGLIHSDGCRSLNYVNGVGYSRYQFTNNSSQIRAIFCQALGFLDISWRIMNWKTISVARKAEVAKLDVFVGPKM